MTTGPKRYPLTLKKFLVITLPALYHKGPRRVAAWREFRKSKWADGAHFSLGANPLRTVKQFADWLNEGNDIPDEGHYFILARCFLAWYAGWREQKTSAERRKAATNRHKKNGAQPPSSRLPDDEMRELFKEAKQAAKIGY